MSDGEQNAHWRYQPVWELDRAGGSRLYFTVEVFIVDGKLDTWMEPSRPAGESMAELLADLLARRNVCDVWEAVDFDELEVGMTFKRKEL